MNPAPSIVLIGGPNGAGKTTISRAVIADTLGIAEFVNADVIAQGMSGFDPDRAALAAGRVMLARLKELAGARMSFAFESTLSSRTFAPWLARLIQDGYQLHLVYSWLNSADLAVARVKKRVRLGGHSIPEEVIRRRYQRSVRNFLHLYLPLAREWRLFDNSRATLPELVAFGDRAGPPTIRSPRAWRQVLEIANAPDRKDD